MTFFKNIMRIDFDLTPLVFAQIDLVKFLKVNIIESDPSCVQASCNFLRSFQQESQFAQNLYEILINNISELADAKTPTKGYSAIIGMLKWALPLDFKRSLQVLLSQLNGNIICSKVKAAQSNHAIKFRTRYKSGNIYPFDNQTFKKAQDEEKSKSNEP